MKIALRTIHTIALLVGLLLMCLAFWSWLHNRWLDRAESVDSQTLAAGGVLLLGLGIVVRLIWISAKPMRTTLRQSVVLHFAWVCIFAWYWFNTFPPVVVRETTLTPGASGNVSRSAISVLFLSLWIAAFWLGPLLKWRNSGH